MICYRLGDEMVHVCRLSDAMHWAFKPPASSPQLNNVSCVDADYVSYHTITSIYRQSIAALGPGDLPP